MLAKIKAIFFKSKKPIVSKRDNNSIYSLLAEASETQSSSRIVMVVGLPHTGKTYMIKRFLGEYNGSSVVINARKDDQYDQLPNCEAVTSFDSKEFIKLAKNRLVIIEDLPILTRKTSAIRDITAFFSVYRHHNSSLILVSQTIDDLDSKHLRFVRVLIVFRSNLSYRKLLNLLPTKKVAENVVRDAKLLNERECFIIDLDTMTRTKVLPNNDAHDVLLRAIEEPQKFQIQLTKLKKSDKPKEEKPPRKKLAREIYFRLKDKPTIEWDYHELARELNTTYKYVKIAVYRLRKKGLLPK